MLASLFAGCVLVLPEPAEWTQATRVKLVSLAFVAAAAVGVRGATVAVQLASALAFALPALVVAARVDEVALPACAPAVGVLALLALARGAQESRGEIARLVGGGAVVAFAACGALTWTLGMHGGGAPEALAAVAWWGPFGVFGASDVTPLVGAAVVAALSFAGPRRQEPLA